MNQKFVIGDNIITKDNAKCVNIINDSFIISPLSDLIGKIIKIDSSDITNINYLIKTDLDNKYWFHQNSLELYK